MSLGCGVAPERSDLAINPYTKEQVAARFQALTPEQQGHLSRLYTLIDEQPAAAWQTNMVQEHPADEFHAFLEVPSPQGPSTRYDIFSLFAIGGLNSCFQIRVGGEVVLDGHRDDPLTLDLHDRLAGKRGEHLQFHDAAVRHQIDQDAGRPYDPKTSIPQTPTQRLSIWWDQEVVTPVHNFLMRM